MTKSVTRAGIYDNVPELYSKEQADKILDEYAPHERAARGFGVPKLGAGLVFPIDEEKIKCAPFKVPPHFRRLIGLDFGLGHPFAAVGTVWDIDSDVIYIARTYKEADALVSTHVAAVKPWGDWIPVAWPHDGHERREVAPQGDTREAGGGFKELAEIYRETGLKSMLSSHATHSTGGYEVEPAITEMWQRMKTGRLKVFSNLEDWFDEFRMYHRKDGMIVKLNDDLMSASRIAVMARRHGIEDAGAWDQLGGDPRHQTSQSDRPNTGY